MQNNFLVIMAGGVGSRFWPLSTQQKPKQFLDILNVGRTLLQQTVDRFDGIIPFENVFIVTSTNYRCIVQQQIPELSDNQILLEPCMRNTAPCIAYAVWKIKASNPNSNIIVAPSDHFIADVDNFKEIVNEGLDFISSHDVLLTFGIMPNKPETGYGYIQSGDVVKGDLFQVKRFAEKPDLKTANEYISTRDYYWNSGIFLWSTKSIESAIRSYNPRLAQIFDNGTGLFNTPKEQFFIDENFPLCENISVDYSILEKAQNIYLRVADFGWSDLGTWGSLHELSAKSNDNNVLKGKIKTYETSESVIHIENPNKKVIVQGLSNFIVVDTGDALLICNKQEEQRIKEFQQ